MPEKSDYLIGWAVEAREVLDTLERGRYRRQAQWLLAPDVYRLAEVAGQICDAMEDAGLPDPTITTVNQGTPDSNATGRRR
jgi:hypothetical protein